MIASGRLMMAALLLLAPANAIAQSCDPAGRSVLFVVDAAGSMAAPLPHGTLRFDAVRAALKNALAQLPADAQVGLRVFGATSKRADRNCADTQLAVGFAPQSSAAGAIGQVLDGVTPQGLTPLAGVLTAATGDFPADASTRVVVLIGDGKDVCKADPVLAARGLGGVIVNTVGFAADAAAQMQLAGIAGATGGSFFAAPTAADLPAALAAALAACPGPVPALAEGEGTLETTSAALALPVLASATSTEVSRLDGTTTTAALPAGLYTVGFGAGSWSGIEIKPGATTTIAPGDLRMDPSTHVTIVDAESGVSFGDLDPETASRTLMPGLYDLRFEETVWRFVAVEGGVTTTLHPASVVLDAGLKWKDHAYVTGADGAIVARFDDDAYTVVLPPGQYVVDIDEARIPFDGTEPGAVLEIKLE